MAQKPVPTFDAELVSTPVKSAITAVGASRGEMWKVSWKKLKILPGFNVRADSPENQQHVAALAQSMLVNGFFRDKPLTGFAAKDGKKDVIYITDGHCRLAAVQIAVQGGAEIDEVPVVLKPASTTMADHTVALAQGNAGKPLTPAEVAVVAKRLIDYGLAEKEVAARLTITTRYLNDLLTFIGSPQKIRRLVETGKLSVTEAVKQLREKGAEAVAAVEEGLKKAEARGKSKVTGKDISASTEPSSDRTVSAGRKKIRETLKLRFKEGERIDLAAIAEVKKLAGGDWWALNEESGKADIVDAIRFDIKIVRNAPAEPDEEIDL